jgi:glutathione peroxidase
MFCVALMLAGFIARPGAAAEAKSKKVAPALDFKMKTLTGQEVNLASFQGKVVLIVNVASKCGNTPQYKPLEALHEKFAGQGLVIVGVPVNDFGKQEPGTNDEIAEFCSKTYDVKFVMLGKVPTVLGADQAPLYKFLTSKETDPKFAGPIKWNFTKFLIGRNGEVVDRFEPKVQPDSPEVVKAIEAELAKK